MSPQRIEIYNSFRRPVCENSATEHRLRRLSEPERTDADAPASLDSYAGCFSMESGRFWSQETRVNCRGRVDSHLLADPQRLEQRLRDSGLPGRVIQGFLGRCLLVRYLFDRGIIEPQPTPGASSNDGSRKLPRLLENRETAYLLFERVEAAFDDGLFPITQAERSLITDWHPDFDGPRLFWSAIRKKSLHFQQLPERIVISPL